MRDYFLVSLMVGAVVAVAVSGWNFVAHGDVLELPFVVWGSMVFGTLLNLVGDDDD